MATFDRTHDHIVVRVVYDGATGAGKTTNLIQLVQSFSPQRRGELASPRRTGSGTSWFDWLYFNGGVVGGFPLRAQLVTTPGRPALSNRRWRIIASADVIVFVCDSTLEGVRAARVALDLLRARLALSGAAPPFIVQVNKQDAADALEPLEVARALDVEPHVEVVGASAIDGTGVRDTVVRAIRAAASDAERSVVSHGIDSFRAPQDEEAMLAALDGSTRLRDLLGADAPPLPEEDPPPIDVWPDPSGARLLRGLLRELAGPVEIQRQSTDTVAVATAGLIAEALERWPHDEMTNARAALLAQAKTSVRLPSFDPTELALALGRNATSVCLWRVRRRDGAVMRGAVR